jgi:hypothetical protein
MRNSTRTVDDWEQPENCNAGKGGHVKYLIYIWQHQFFALDALLLK